MKNKILFYFFSLFVYLFLVVSPASASETNILACNNFYGITYAHDTAVVPIWLPGDANPGITFGLTQNASFNIALLPLTRATSPFLYSLDGNLSIWLNVYHGATIIATSTLLNLPTEDSLSAIPGLPGINGASSTWVNFFFSDGVTLAGGDNTYRLAIKSNQGSSQAPMFYSEQSFP